MVTCSPKDRNTAYDLGVSQPIHPGVRIGHVHLKVAGLDRSLDLRGLLAERATG